jgi:hypothetical protein
VKPFIEKVAKALTPNQWKLAATGAEALLAGVGLGLVLYTGIQIAGSYMKNHDFQEAVKHEAQLAASDSRPAANIRQELLEKSQEMGLRVNPDDINVVSARKEAQIPVAGLSALVENGNQNDLPTVGSVNIDVNYAVPVEFPLYTLRLNFHLHADDHTI